MRLITNKSKNLLYRINAEVNVAVQFGTSYAIATQQTADTKALVFAIQGRSTTDIVSLTKVNEVSLGKLITTFTTPSSTGYYYIRFGLDGSQRNTMCNCAIDLKPSTTYTFTCNFTNITQGSVSWKDMMLVEGSTVGDYEPYSYNLLDKWQYTATNTVNGVTFTNNGDGSLTVNGTATKKTAFKFFRYQTKLSKGDKICLSNPIDLESYGKLWYEISLQYTDGSYIYLTDVYLNTLLLANDVSMIDGFIVVGAGETVSGALLKPAIYDLTLMYGAGNEPTTVNQFYADHPELKVSPLGFIGLKNIEISNKNIKRLKYKTWNNNLNLIDKSKFNHSETTRGVTFTNNDDGSWTVNGTSTAQIYLSIINKSTTNIRLDTSHKYLLSGCPKEGSSNLFLYVDSGGALFDYDTGNGSIGTPTKTAATITISVARNTVVNNSIFKPQLYDLTAIYGAGKEPTTVEQFYKDHPLAKTSPLGFSDLGIIPSNSGYILNKYNNLSEELLEENVEKDTVNYHIPDKTNILLNKVEGKTNKIVQEIDVTKTPATTTKNGITCTNNRDGSWTVNGTSTATEITYFRINNENTLPAINEHIYCSLGCPSGGAISSYRIESSFGNDAGNGTVYKLNRDIGYGNVYIGIAAGYTANNLIFKPQVFDLTAMYGFGNEPTTVEQFKKDYPQFFDEKLDGVWNVRTSGISTTGKNLFDIDSVSFFTKDSNGEYKSNTYIGIYPDYVLWTPVDGTKQITISGYVKCPVDKNYRFAVLYEDGTEASSYISSTGDYLYNSYTSDSSKKIKYVYLHYTVGSNEVYIKDVQIEEGSTVTSYESYQENKIDLLSTQTLNGINGVNDYIEVIDKGNGLYDLKKTQNINSVDLGTLNWAVDGSNFYSDSISSLIKPPANDNSVGNYVCQKYVNCALSKSFVDGDFGVNSSGLVYFRNSAYTTAAAFKTAMNGVILYYQLKTPVTTTIATNLTYNQVSAVRTNGGLLLVNDNNNQKYAQPNVTITENYQYKS